MTDEQRDHLHNNTAKLLAVSLLSLSSDIGVCVDNSLPTRSYNKDTLLSNMLFPQHMLRQSMTRYQRARGEHTLWNKLLKMPRLLISRERT